MVVVLNHPKAAVIEGLRDAQSLLEKAMDAENERVGSISDLIEEVIQYAYLTLPSDGDE